ncbi:MAG TPA: isocitrate lyase/PEP mutase family protein [Chloroflexota bacterium]|nr:isocitrate lyase/PEP mutase family protein [Chloroflexota bacterium]
MSEATLRATTRLRALIQRPEPLIMPGGFSPYLARMAEAVGCEAYFLAGSQTAAFLYGLPDVGIMGMRDLVDHARHLAARCGIPIFVDADTGFGNAVGVYYTVQEYVRAGVAGLHLEDQEAPKKSGKHAGRRCISVEEAVGKYRAAVAARDALDPDFVICARCDLIGAEGGTFEGAIERATAYLQDGGVDIVWMNSMNTREEIREVCRRVPGPVMVSYYGAPPTPSLAEWRELGPAVVIFPAIVASVAAQAAWDFLHDFRAQGPAALDAWRGKGGESRWGRPPTDTLLGDDFVVQLEERYLPAELRRDYEGTFGHH